MYLSGSRIMPFFLPFFFRFSFFLKSCDIVLKEVKVSLEKHSVIVDMLFVEEGNNLY